MTFGKELLGAKHSLSTVHAETLESVHIFMFRYHLKQ